jgi:transcriptional regulator with XRE-family HTH domain
MKKHLYKEANPELAYYFWYRQCGYQSFDDEVATALSEKLLGNSGGNLRKAREALFLSSLEMASRLGVSKRAYLKIEASDKLAVIKMSTLFKVADAMDCELVYAIRPKTRIRYSRAVWNRLLLEAEKSIMYQRGKGIQKQRALFGAAKRAFADPVFAQQSRFSQKRMRMLHGSE